MVPYKDDAVCGHEQRVVGHHLKVGKKLSLFLCPTFHDNCCNYRHTLLYFCIQAEFYSGTRVKLILKMILKLFKNIHDFF